MDKETGISQEERDFFAGRSVPAILPNRFRSASDLAAAYEASLSAAEERFETLQNIARTFLRGLYDMRERGLLSEMAIPDDDEWMAQMMEDLENAVGGKPVTKSLKGVSE